MITAITNARIFDGEKVIGAETVLIEGEKIISVGGEIPEDATIIDAGRRDFASRSDRCACSYFRGRSEGRSAIRSNDRTGNDGRIHEKWP